jgi:Outer membrane protein beta-barrel domain
MNTKKILLGLLVFGTSIICFSQGKVTFGAKVGLNVSSLPGNYPVGVDSKSKVGFHVGATTEVELTSKFSILGELLVSTQGNVVENKDLQEDTGTTQTLKLTNLNIPILLKFHVLPKLSIECGPQIGFVINANNNFKLYQISNPSNTISFEFNPLKDGTFNFQGQNIPYKKGIKGTDFSLNLGATFDITDKFYVQARYNRGLSNVDTNSTVSGNITESLGLKNSVLQLSLGYKF